jgi:hypothetical protein
VAAVAEARNYVWWAGGTADIAWVSWEEL